LDVFDGDESDAALGEGGNESAQVLNLAVQDEHEFVLFAERR